MEKKYFRSLEELSIDLEREENKTYGDKKFMLQMQEESKSNGTSRRDFLKAFGFTIASAAIASSCEQPVRKAIPLLVQPEGIIPGKAVYYATSYFDGVDYGSVLAKVRDGRPIKIEGNKLSPVTRGGTSARMQASVLDLYDDIRYKGPKSAGNDTDWETIDAEIVSRLAAVKAKGGRIVLLTPTVTGIGSNAVINEFKKAFPETTHIQYDVLSAAGMLKANEATFGRAFIPNYRFDKAELIVSFDADFLGTWLSPVEFASQYAIGRKVNDEKKSMSRHIHIEGNFSMTGSNADERLQLRPSQQKAVLAGLLNALKNKAGMSASGSYSLPVDVNRLADELWEHAGKSLVVCGSNDAEDQILVNAINQLLGNYGNTIETDIHLKLRKADDTQMAALLSDAAGGSVDAIIVWDVNPVFDYPGFADAMAKIPLKISLAVHKDETAEAADFVCPDHHYLESWGDVEAKTGVYSTTQPAIRPIFNTRAAQSSLLRWAGQDSDYRTYLQKVWENTVYPKSGFVGSFTAFWNKCIHDGVCETGEKEPALSPNALAVASAINARPSNTDEIELSLYTTVGVGTGKHGNNPWLQELPDPVSKVCWDNYLAISPKLAAEMGIKDEMLVKVNGIELPALIQPGQEYKTLGIALGYGHEVGGAASKGIGKNAYPLLEVRDGIRYFNVSNVNLSVANGKYRIARTQTHHSMEGRAIVRETTLAEWKDNPMAGNEMRKEIQEHLKSLYPKASFDGLHWGMAIDLNSCTGCNACVVACSSENNVPVVGKDQVLMVREMHWIRIDRYYTGDPDNPAIVRQPVMCQHCDNAPCENVCPVAATTHSTEGINQMAYNRCIGTRYCANNCPYKVRRFNFFDYTGADTFKGNRYDKVEMSSDLRRMVLNPDVTVRAKGVIEKCSFCVQRIQDKKLEAKKEGRQLRDGEVVPACAQACPSQAIVFGNLNDKDSKVSKYYADQRNYHLLEELHTLPSVGYLTKVKNTSV
ncbi:MAG TPA: TAT-variant-translocated molybdopterin oxidoreductase [Bacteroidales bacterium]|nr:TAT-variant-translocated molybdopterin oxidoreductase [Bacteroidales bacterium]